MNMVKVCLLCKRKFETANAEKKYCSRKCSVKFRKKLKQNTNINRR